VALRTNRAPQRAPQRYGLHAADGLPVRAGLSAWLRADRGVTLNGSNVSAVRDLSGRGADGLQTAAGNQPLYKLDDQRPFLDCDPAGRFLGLATPGSAATNAASGCTLVAVYRQDDTTERRIWYVSGGSFGNIRALLRMVLDNYRMGGARADGDSFVERNGGALIVGRRVVLVGTVSHDEASTRLYLNGRMAFNGTSGLTAGTAYSATNSASVLLGFTSNLGGSVYEAAVYNRGLSVGEAVALSRALMERYGARP
jgi:hypothetical protein